MKVISTMGPLSGSLGGMTASRNKGGQYFRQRVIPTNPNSTRQQAQRAAFGTAVQRWTNTLTDAQRVGWDTYAQNVPLTDTLGQALQLSGQQMYVRTNAFRIGVGLAPVDAAPTIFDTGEVVTQVEDAFSNTPDSLGTDGGTADTVYTFGAPLSDDGDLIVFYGEPVNPTKTFFKGPYQFSVALAVAATDTSVTDGTVTGSQAQAVALVDGQYRGVRARIAYDDGRLSQPFEVLCNVLPAV